MFPEQKEFVLDNSEFKAAVCTRRAGKSSGMVRQLLLAAISKPRSVVYFLALEQRSVRAVGWKNFIELVEDLDFPDELISMQHAKMEARLANGSMISFLGADDPNVQETLRGGAFSLVVIDELGSWKKERLEYFVYQVLAPALADHAGQISGIGTPPKESNSFLESIFKNTDWKTFKWSWKDNPHVDNAKMESVIDKVCKARNVDRTDPAIQREFYGKFVYDTHDLLFRFSDENIITNCPLEQPKYALGVDFGYRDANAISVLAFNEAESNITYVIDEYKKEEVTLTGFAAVIKDFLEKYPPISHYHTAADYGGLGRMLLEELRKHHGIYLNGADKREKGPTIRITDDCFRTQKLMVLERCRDTIEELKNLKRDLKKPDLPAENQQDHLTDSLLYAFRLTSAFLYRKQVRYVDGGDSMTRYAGDFFGVSLTDGEERESSRLLKYFPELKTVQGTDGGRKEGARSFRVVKAVTPFTGFKTFEVPKGTPNN